MSYGCGHQQTETVRSCRRKKKYVDGMLKVISAYYNVKEIQNLIYASYAFPLNFNLEIQLHVRPKMNIIK